MSFNIIKYLCDALDLNESALSKIGISIYDSEGKIKNVTAIFDEISRSLEQRFRGENKE